MATQVMLSQGYKDVVFSSPWRLL